mgnify:CR=1 FL=1
MYFLIKKNKRLLAEREVCMEKYHTEVVLTVRTERSEVRTKKNEIWYIYIQTEQARLISRLLYDFFYFR